MVALSDERGQALVIVVLLLGIAAASVVGLRAAQDRIVAAAREQRAGEAAVEAAAASLADAYVAQVAAAGTRAPESPRSTPDLLPRLVADPRVIQAARMAADDVARANDARPTDSLEATCSERRVEARLTLRGYPHRAAFAAPECSRR